MKVTLGDLVDKLSIVNLKIWHLEEGLRRADLGGCDEDVSDAEAGRLAKQIRDLNRQRVAYINALNEYDAEAFPIVKVKHRSA